MVGNSKIVNGKSHRGVFFENVVEKVERFAKTLIGLGK